MFVRKRALLYSSLYSIYEQNRNSTIKAPHLFSLLYSKYHTERFILRSQSVEADTLENDEALKQQFAAMIDNPNIAGKIEFRDKYLEIISQQKEKDIAQKYAELDEKICARKMEMDDDTQELFSIGSAETDEYLEDKLGRDILLFQGPKKRALGFLQTYRFVNGWIFSLGVVVFSIAFASVTMVPAMAMRTKRSLRPLVDFFFKN